MMMLGTLINTAGVLVFGLIGSLLRRGIPERINRTVLAGMGICVIYIGIDGALAAAPAIAADSVLAGQEGLVKVIVMILSVGIGALIGEWIDIDRAVTRLGDFLQRKLTHGAAGEEGRPGIAPGFVNCTILFCVGAMAINGAIEDAMGHPDILIAKAIIDSITVLVMSTSLGIGCALASLSVLVYQGTITLLAHLIAPYISAAALTLMSCTGSLNIVMIGLNLLGVTKIRTANFIPAMFLPILFCLFIPFA